MSNIYQNALDSQNAPNLGALVKTLATDIDEIWKEAREQGLGTDYVNEHPVIRLYLEQMVFLNKSGSITDGQNTYSKAYMSCTAKVE